MRLLQPDEITRPRRDAVGAEYTLNPSGVDNLTPYEVRMRMHALGWAVLPVLPHDVLSGGAGKAPAIRGFNTDAFGYDKEITTPAVIASWRTGTSGSGGTGICCNQVAAIDIDVATSQELSDKLKNHAETVFGSTDFIRVGNAPKILLLYRRDPTVKKSRLKCASGSGDGLDIIVDSHFVAYGIHPKTKRYYSWIGQSSPLGTGPDTLPVISQTQVHEFLARVEADMDLNKTGGRTGGGTRQEQVTRDSEGRVVSGRDYHLYTTVRNVWYSMHREGAAITVQTLADRAWREFSETTNLIGTKESYREALKKASWRLKHQDSWLPQRVISAGEPTYRKTRVLLDEAESEIARHITEFGAQSTIRRDAIKRKKEEEQRIRKENDEAMPF